MAMKSSTFNIIWESKDQSNGTRGTARSETADFNVYNARGFGTPDVLPITIPQKGDRIIVGLA
jgi:hypothetical protein